VSHFVPFISVDDLRFLGLLLLCATENFVKIMASIYHKNCSPVIWIRYKNEEDKWKGKPTQYRWNNFGEVRQAKLLARKQTEIEQTRPGAAAITISTPGW
jgi:hypothetical protein